MAGRFFQRSRWWVLIILLGIALYGGGCACDGDNGDTAQVDAGGSSSTDEPAPVDPEPDAEPDPTPEPEEMAEDDVADLLVVAEPYVVRGGDTLVKIVEAECPDDFDVGLVVANFLINRGAEQPDGDRYIDINRIEIGWELVIDCGLDPVMEAREAGECLEGFNPIFSGRTETFDNGEYRDVTVCVDRNGVGDFYAADQFGRRDIRLQACVDDAGVLVAEFQDSVFSIDPWTIYERVSPNGVVRTLAFSDDVETFDDMSEIAACRPQPVVYPILELPENRLMVAAQGAAESYPPEGACLASVPQQAAFQLPPEDLPDGPIFVEQGDALRFATDSPGELALTGGSHSWPLTELPSVDERFWHTLEIDERHPIGRYELEGVDLPPGSEVIIEPARTLQLSFDSRQGDVVRFVVLGAHEAVVDIFRSAYVDCRHEWRIWERGGTVEANAEGNAAIVLDTGRLPDGEYCFVPSGQGPRCTRVGHFEPS